MAKITLSKALKVKNRLAGRLAKLTGDIQLYNSVVEGREQPDIDQLLKRRGQTQDAIVSLKASIHEANRGIIGMIFTLAERQGDVVMLNGLETKTGPVLEHYKQQPSIYHAAVTKERADARVRELEREIDGLQDRIDQYNHDTTVNVDDGILDMAQ